FVYHHPERMQDPIFPPGNLFFSERNDALPPCTDFFLKSFHEKSLFMCVCSIIIKRYFLKAWTASRTHFFFLKIMLINIFQSMFSFRKCQQVKSCQHNGFRDLRSNISCCENL